MFVLILPTKPTLPIPSSECISTTTAAISVHNSQFLALVTVVFLPLATRRQMLDILRFGKCQRCCWLERTRGNPVSPL